MNPLDPQYIQISKAVNMKTSAESTENWEFETKQIHAGQSPDETTLSRALPIYQTTAYTFRDAAHASALFNLEEQGNIYTRVMNPTQDVVEQRIAALEGGTAALLVSSGQAAVTIAILTLARAGDHIVASPRVYAGTYMLFNYTLPQLGINVSIIDDPEDLDQWRKAIRANTKALFGETVANPANNILDIDGIAEVAHLAGVPLVVDNTIATPYLVRPLEHGADIVVHSATKWLGGHGTVIAGVIVDGGSFDWTTGGRFPGLTTPDPTYHVVFADFGPSAFAMKARMHLLRDLGSALSPFNAFLLAQGLETLSLRMERHVQNAQAVAEFLATRDEVTEVHYAGLPSSPWYERGKKLAPKGVGSVVAFELAGGLDAGRRFVEALTLHSHVSNIGDVRSLVIHHASTTHSLLSAEERLSSGVTPGLVRLSVGLEHINDILTDLRKGLAATA
jgi:O-acetylhomoserine (thiol)-lyase